MGRCKIDAITDAQGAMQYAEYLLPRFKKYEEKGDYECFVSYPEDEDLEGDEDLEQEEYEPPIEKMTPTGALSAFLEDPNKYVHCFFHKTGDYFLINRVRLDGEDVFRLSNYYDKETVPQKEGRTFVAHMYREGGGIVDSIPYPRNFIRTESCESYPAKIHVKGKRLGIEDLFSMWHRLL